MDRGYHDLARLYALCQAGSFFVTRAKHNVPAAIIKKELKLNASLHTLLQILSVTLFEKVSLQQVLKEIDMPQNPPDSANQLNLFDP